MADMRANLRKLYESYKSYISRRRAPLFTADEKELALLRLQQELADFSFYRHAEF